MKKFLTTAVLAGLSICSFQAMAISFNGLSLCQKNGTSEITVTCNGVKSPAPIPINGCAHIGPVSNLPWTAIASQILKGAKKATCYFTIGNTKLAHAQVEISDNYQQGKVSNVVMEPDTIYNVNVDYENAFVDNVTATISH